MEARYDYVKSAPGVPQALIGVEEYLHTCGLEESLLNLVRLRASQINGCEVGIELQWDENDFSVVAQWKKLRALCESELRLRGLESWRTSPYCSNYSERERASLAWTEAVTLVANAPIPDSLYDEVRLHFSDKEMSDLTLAIANANAWNRLSIASLREASLYRTGEPQEQRRVS
jgi:alkylhydroperoxidase family enzyme